MKKYLLILSDEDGEPCEFLDEKELQEVLADPLEYAGIDKFLTKIPKQDPMYWDEGTALLLEIKIIDPKNMILHKA